MATPRVVRSSTAASMSSTSKFRTVKVAGWWSGFGYMKTEPPPGSWILAPTPSGSTVNPRVAEYISFAVPRSSTENPLNADLGLNIANLLFLVLADRHLVGNAFGGCVITHRFR